MVAEFHAGMLNRLSTKVAALTPTLNDAIGKLKALQIHVDRKLTAKMRHLDQVYKICRHLNQALLDQVQREIDDIPARATLKTRDPFGDNVNGEPFDPKQLTMDRFIGMWKVQAAEARIKNAEEERVRIELKLATIRRGIAASRILRFLRKAVEEKKKKREEEQIGRILVGVKELSADMKELRDPVRSAHFLVAAARKSVKDSGEAFPALEQVVMKICEGGAPSVFTPNTESALVFAGAAKAKEGKKESKKGKQVRFGT